MFFLLPKNLPVCFLSARFFCCLLFFFFFFFFFSFSQPSATRNWYETLGVNRTLLAICEPAFRLDVTLAVGWAWNGKNQSINQSFIHVFLFHSPLFDALEHINTNSPSRYYLYVFLLFLSEITKIALQRTGRLETGRKRFRTAAPKAAHPDPERPWLDRHIKAGSAEGRGAVAVVAEDDWEIDGHSSCSP